MLRYILGVWIHDPFRVRDLVNNVYWSIIVIAIFTGCCLIYKKLIGLVQDKKRVRIFMVVFFGLALPLGVVSSKAANMFYLPVHYWSVDRFIEEFFNGGQQTFHTSIMIPVVMAACLIRLFRMNFWKVFDIIFLYVPFSHAIARTACLMAGCCHGHRICLDIFGFSACFKNPVPLYESIFNLVLFYFLRRVFSLIYPTGKEPDTSLFERTFGPFFQGLEQRVQGGIIVALYLIGYGIWRFNIEFIRTNPIVELGMTQAQLVMICFGVLALVILFRGRIRPLKDRLREGILKKKENQSLMGFLLSYFFLVLLIVGLFKYRIIDWPFRSYGSFSKIYFNVFLYALFAVMCSGFFFWLRPLNIRISPFFKWRRFSHIFWVGLVISSAYSVYLYHFNTWNLGGMAYWPPIFLFSVLNAYSEESIYRLTLSSVLERLFGSHVAANLGQALLYGGTHYFIGGARFALFAFLYGILLGTVTKENKSIIPAMICHFCIDIGNIGLPLLIVRNSYFG
ncbi:MAG: prolipoprotein diacylglyceryl transferase [Desulfobacter sp.]|nr:MAG: prolipoprotein diacylglyceryl transferase [Desulfobacter sp.]